MSTESEYYIMDGANQRGPLTLSQLRALWQTGHVTITTAFWCEGMIEWGKLGQMQKILDVPAENKNAGEDAVTKPASWTWIVALVIAFPLVFFTIIATVARQSSNQGSPRVQNEPPKQIQIESFDASLVQVLGDYAYVSWKVVLRNETSATRKVAVRFKFLDDSDFLLFEGFEYPVIVGANETITVTKQEIQKASVYKRVKMLRASVQ